MDPRLKAIVEDVQEAFMRDPLPEVDAGTMLQYKIFVDGLEDAFSEDDVIKAAKEVGVAADEIPSWLEEMASWL